MTASHNVPQVPLSRKSTVNRSGVFTLSGFGIKVWIQAGHLHIEDGIGMDRRKIRLARVGHGLKRLVIVGSDGFVSLAALRWLTDQNAGFVLLERDGKTICVTGPVGSSDAKLRRAQALAIGNGMGLEICRRLIEAKLQGQEKVLREHLNRQATADTIAHFRNQLGLTESFDAIRNLEANAAAAYFREWRDLPVAWPKADLEKIPAHWRFVGSRQSPLTGGPRLAVTPVHAILNYCFALLHAETRLAISALGLDPGLGLGLHTDTADRDSLAFDVLEPVRPRVEAWILDWIAKEPLRRADFFETETGNCRLRSEICTKLSGTAFTWGKLVAPWVENVARTLWTGAKSRGIGNSLPPTRLTQQRRIEAKGRVWISKVEPPKVNHLCRGCGKTITNESTHCANCAVDKATERLIGVASLGRKAARSPEARAKHAATRRRHAKACSEWDASTRPAWITDQVYTEEIQPQLPQVSTSAIASRIGVSRWYAGQIRKGYCPHPRHWMALGELVGFRPNRDA